MNSSLKLVGVICGYVISIYFLYLFFKDFNLSGILDKAQLSENFYYYIFAMGIFLISLYFRSLRWEAMVYGNILPKSKRSGKVYLTYLVSDGLNNILPFRMGDIYRVMITRDNSEASLSKLFILLLVERVLDLIILFLFGALALFFIKDIEIIQIIFFNLIEWIFSNKYLFFLIGIIIVLSIYSIKKSTYFYPKFQNVTINLKRIKIPILNVFILTLLTWLLEFIVFFVVFKVLLIKIDIVEMFVVFVMSTLSTLIPSAPGYVGTFHFFSSQSLDLFNISNSIAGFFAIIIHLIIVLPTILIGVFYLNISFIGVIKKSFKIKYE
jgi:glycosyltransferase 2 family protein